MTFHRIYRPVFNVVSLLGVVPFNNNSKNPQQFSASFAKCIYSVMIAISIDALFIFGVIVEINHKFDTKMVNGSTLFYLTTLQEFFNVFMYAIVIINSITIARSHADFLNSLSDLERKVEIYLLRHKYKPSDIHHPRLDAIWIPILLVVWTCLFNSFLEVSLGPKNYRFVSVLYVWMCITHFCNGLYTRLLSIFINRNIRSLRMYFAHNPIAFLADDLEILDEVDHIKDMFVTVFSRNVIISFFYDFGTMLAMVFWAIYTVVYINTMQTKIDAVTIVFTYILPYFVKIFLVTNAAEGFTTEVSIRL